MELKLQGEDELKKNLKIFIAALVLGSSLTATSFARPPYVVVGYAPSWNSNPNYVIDLSAIPYGDITHIYDAFAIVTGAASVSFTRPAGLIVREAHAQGVRVYLSVGGASTNNVWPASSAAATTLADYLATQMVQTTADGAAVTYDGIDVDWEFPSTAAVFTSLMQELRTKLNTRSPGLAPSGSYPESNVGLTFFMSPGASTCGYNLPVLGTTVDWGFVGGYDMNIGVGGLAYQGPLVNASTASGCSGTITLSDSSLVNLYKTGGMPANKMILGCPLYARDTAGANTIPIITLLKGGSAGAYNAGFAEQPYTFTGTAYNSAGTAVAVSGDTFGADVQQSFCDKINWQKGQGMIGIGLWDVGQAMPASDAAVTGIWNTIADNTACVTITGGCKSGGCVATPTLSPTPACGKFVDNLESGMFTNSLGGFWTASIPGTCPGATTNPMVGTQYYPSYNYGLNSSFFGARFYGVNSTSYAAAGPCYAPPGLICSLGPTASVTFNAGTSTNLEFDLKVGIMAPSGPTQIQVLAYSNNALGVVPINYAEYTYNVTVNTVNQETHVSIPLASFSPPATGTAYPLQTNNLRYVAWRVNWAGGNYDFTVDNVWFTCAPTPTPTSGASTPTFTKTNTPTNTLTPTLTKTNTPVPPTNTFTFTVTRTNTSTNTPVPPTNTFTRTNTPTLTNTNTPVPPTSTFTPTRTNTNTNTPVPPTNTFTRTNTPTITNTNTPVPPTNTFTSTRTNTPTNTNTPIAPTNTFTLTNTRTNTPSPTNTNTPAPPTSSFTPTNTRTFTNTNTPAPPTNTPTITHTNTNTPVPPTNTFTSTKTNTPTSTNTNTPAPPTNTFTVTNTRTNTNTPVPPTSTFTLTNTRTFTNTNTPAPPTNTFTATVTPTLTFTGQPTATNTNTPLPPTNTFTSTKTNTPTSTNTNTPVPPTNTSTNTSTKTNTPTSTNTPVPPTSTFTPTVTNTGTSTFTPTNSFTGTLSPTATFTNTNSPTKTFTSTSTSTSTSTLTSTSTSTSTFTAVSTATFTNTSTRTFTPTPTSTSTSTATATYTATQPMVQVSLGASLPATQVVGGASNVPVLELNVSNQSGETVQLTGTTLTAGGTASSATGVASLAVYQVVGGNPVLLETILNPFASSNTPTIPLPSLNVPAGSTQTYLITYTFGSGAQAGSYTVGVINGNDLTGHGLTSGKGLNVTGAPVNGAVVTLAVSTATSTSTSTVTTTATVTATGTPTKTKTPSTAKTPIIFPNPSTGDPISIYVPGNGIAHVKVEIFTTAFRKVQEANFDNIPLGVMGSAPRVPMTDKSGDLLASGLYYVVITTAPTTSTGGGAQRLVGKFLLLK